MNQCAWARQRSGKRNLERCGIVAELALSRRKPKVLPIVLRIAQIKIEVFKPHTGVEEPLVVRPVLIGNCIGIESRNDVIEGGARCIVRDYPGSVHRWERDWLRVRTGSCRAVAYSDGARLRETNRAVGVVRRSRIRSSGVEQCRVIGAYRRRRRIICSDVQQM